MLNCYPVLLEKNKLTLLYKYLIKLSIEKFESESDFGLGLPYYYLPPHMVKSIFVWNANTVRAKVTPQVIPTAISTASV